MKNWLKEKWIRFWMRFAGPKGFGRFATRLATWPAPPFYKRVRLAEMNAAGYFAPSVVIDHPKLRTGRHVFLGDGVQIFEGEGGAAMEIGDRVQILDNCRLYTGKGARAVIGEDTHMQLGCYLYAYISDIHIGRGVEIAAGCAFYSYDHGFAPGETIMEQPMQSKGPIRVGDGAWLAHGVTVLSGVSIGEGAVISAGSVVVRDIPPNAIAAGIPARVIMFRDENATGAQIVASKNAASPEATGI